jgi:hypothetical protein
MLCTDIWIFYYISDKCKLYVFVGYSIPPLFCVFDYCLILIYTVLFISGEDKSVSMTNVNLLWPRLRKGSNICLFLSIFMTEQQNKLVNSGLNILVTASMVSNIITPTVSKTRAKRLC